MNFSAFGSHFSNLQFTTHKFENSPSFAAQQDGLAGRYHSPNNFQQNLAVSSPQIQQQPPQQQFSQSVTSIPYNGGSSEHNFVTPNSNNNNTNGMNNGGEHKPNPSHLHNSVKVPSVKGADRDREEALNQQILQNVNQSWQTLASANPTSSTVDYSSHILSATLPISIQHFLKYSETIKKETGLPPTNGTGSPSTTTTTLLGNVGVDGNGPVPAAEVPTTTSTGKKKKKKAQKAPKVRAVREKKPRPKPGEIRETKALDGSPLFCCPECQMAYPDRSLIEQHVISHAVERRFVCDICNAALKRKDHLTRHKLSHIPDRPHVCNICMKSFKRKEQLTLHIVIHSGEKKHICQECGKGFYRKDHLRKHTRSHIARRVKSEVTAQGSTSGNGTSNSGGQAQAP